ncbi:MAG: methyltransferase family protein [Promethearchaeota archaeon]
MGRFEELKEKYPRGMIAVQGIWIVMLSTIFAYILITPLIIFNIDEQILIDIFTFPPDILPQPYNLIGILFIPTGFFLIIWANYALLHIGKIGLRAREPMQRPKTLMIAGPYKFSRNPLYLGCLVALVGLVIVCSSIVIACFTILVYIVFRYIFIKREEIILEEEFGDEYRNFKKRVRRWL